MLKKTSIFFIVLLMIASVTFAAFAADEHDEQILSAPAPQEHNIMLTAKPEEHNIMLGAAPSWLNEAGEERTVSGVKFYVSVNGENSAMIEGDGITWVFVEYLGKGAWYGIDNSMGTFEPGSRFWTKLITSNEYREEYNLLMDKLDRSSRLSDGKNHCIIMVGVENPEGVQYSVLDHSTNLYVQLGNNWNVESIRSMFISEKQDEAIPVFVKNVTCPEGPDTFAVLGLTHLGEPVVIGETVSLFASIFSQYQPFLTIALAVIVIAAVVIFVLKTKKKN